MAATFPAVILFQIVAALIALGIMLVALALFLTLQPGSSMTVTNPFIMIVIIVATFASFSVMLTMSVMGFYEGWRIGWACAKGRTLRDAIEQGPSARIVRRLLFKQRLNV